MKFLSLILAIFFVALSAIPCPDVFVEQELHHNEISGHDHGQEEGDGCPITCVCNCCGMPLGFEPLEIYNLMSFDTTITTQLNSIYQSIYRYDFHSNIWQPPQVIS